MGEVRVCFGQISATEVLRDIRSAYERADLDMAEQRIAEAMAQYEQFSAVDLAQVHEFSALVNYVKGDATEAEKQLGLALQLNPSLELDSILAPPGLVQIAEQLKTALQESGQIAEEEPEVRYLVLADPRPSAAMRSMLVPGWGQVYKGDRKKGYRMLGAWGLTAGGTLTAHILRKSAENKYLDATTLAGAQSLYDDFNRWHQVRNNLFLAAAGVWVYSYLDALIFQAPVGDQRVQFHAVPGPTGPDMHLVVRF